MADPQCQHTLSNGTLWCKPCWRRHFVNNFNDWTTGHDNIDEFIRTTQLEANKVTDYLHFIPSGELTIETTYKNAEVGIVQIACWIGGPQDVWDDNTYAYKRRGDLKVAVQYISEDPDEFLQELKMQYYGRQNNSLILRLFGVTQHQGELRIVAETKEFDLRRCVSHHWSQITWGIKLAILHQVALKIRDKQHPNSHEAPKSHIEISVNEYGITYQTTPIPVIGYCKFDIIPFFAPEILLKQWEYHASQDIYTFAMFMWEITCNLPPFRKQPRDQNWINQFKKGFHLKINNAPCCYQQLFERCSEFDPQQRPSIDQVIEKLEDCILNYETWFTKWEDARQGFLKQNKIDCDPNAIYQPSDIVHESAFYQRRVLKFAPMGQPQNRSVKRRDTDQKTTPDQSFFKNTTIMQYRYKPQEMNYKFGLY